jgi:hypothetical protein
MDNLIKALTLKENEIKSIFDDFSEISIRSAYGSGKKPEEPDVVAMMTLKSVPYIASNIKQLLISSKIGITISSIFCHQNPIVEFSVGNTAKRCELGDLLIVHVHRDKKNIFYRNALLLQVKRIADKKTFHKVTSKESIQLKLYKEWPIFHYFKIGCPDLRKSKVTRNVNLKDRHPGAQYLIFNSRPLISRYYKSYCPLTSLYSSSLMSIVPANEVLPHSSSFALSNEMFKFLCGFSGRSYMNKGGTGWSQVIRDLLRCSQSIFNRRNIGVINQPRRSFFLSEFDMSKSEEILQEEIIRRFNIAINGENMEPPNDREMSDEDPENNGGISVILINTSELE